MPRFRFALSDAKFVREVGMVQSDTFDDAMSAVTERFMASPGDNLEIGVYGFPPARYLYVSALDGISSNWRPVGEKAA
jgi:hypothetical protein